MAMPERRRQLVGAALAIATHEGIEAVTVRRVAEEAGVSLGVVHYCFQTKAELITEMASAIVSETAEAGQNRVAVARDNGSEAPRPRTIVAAIRAGIDAIWEVIEATPDIQLLTYEITTHALRQPGLSEVARRRYAVSQQATEEFLKVAADSAGVQWRRPLSDLASLVVVVLDGVRLRWLVDGDSTAARERLYTFAEALARNAS